MMDFGSHRIEALVRLLGPVREVSGWRASILFERAVEDSGEIVLHFESGTRGSVAVTHAAIEPRDTLDIYGSEGSLHCAELNRGDLRIVTAAGDAVEQHPPHANLHQPLVEDFIAAVREGREPEVGGADGRDVQRLLAEFYRQ